jgi:hypothetical protein
MARVLAEPRKPSEGYQRVRLDGSIGEPAWREAMAAFENAERSLDAVNPYRTATERVVALQHFRKGSERALKEYSPRTLQFREAIAGVLGAPAPNPCEIAHKLRLLAYVEGMRDPINGTPSRSSVLETTLAQIVMDAMIVQQHHDPDRFTKSGKRRKGKR